MKLLGQIFTLAESCNNYVILNHTQALWQSVLTDTIKNCDKFSMIFSIW
jgi:hypothetical protein